MSSQKQISNKEKLEQNFIITIKLQYLPSLLSYFILLMRNKSLQDLLYEQEILELELQDVKYQLKSSLGRGGFGQVYLISPCHSIAHSDQDQNLYAAKIINKRQFDYEDKQPYFNNQATLLRLFKNQENIVNLVQEKETKTFKLLIMEYFNHGNLVEYIQKVYTKKKLTLSVITNFMAQIFKGLHNMHSQKVIHRDLKPENILVHEKGKNIILKIGDLGLSKKFNSSGANTNCGSDRFKAPEMFLQEKYTISVDLWALGVIFYNMLFNSLPFEGPKIIDDIFRKCLVEFRLKPQIKKSYKAYNLTKRQMDDAEDFFTKLFRFNPKNRLTFSEAINHPIFGYKQQQLCKVYEFYKKNENLLDAQNLQIFSKLNYLFYFINEKDAIIKVDNILGQIQKIINQKLFLKSCSDYFSQLHEDLTLGQKSYIQYYVLVIFQLQSEKLLSQLENLIEDNISYLLKMVWDMFGWKRYQNLLAQFRDLLELAVCKRKKSYKYVKFLCNNMSFKAQNMVQFCQMVERQQTNKQKMKRLYQEGTFAFIMMIKGSEYIEKKKKMKILLKLIICHLHSQILCGRQRIENDISAYIDWLNEKQEKNKNKIYLDQWIEIASIQDLEKSIKQISDRYKEQMVEF